MYNMGYNLYNMEYTMYEVHIIILNFQMCGDRDKKLTKEEVIMILKLVLDINEEKATQIYGTIDTKDEGSITYCKYSPLTI